ncbi:TPA: nicotinate-nucleotide--dimethylbenzimidazole phosphoribosyltransferase [Candidatus Latescibacteria bacterium]|nr:nicotinate-nucleotide--dimethylbenzimidazole phosphoribosyltransferase [Candidatus Latescibacterota bacterium]
MGLLENTIEAIQPVDEAAGERARSRLEQLTMPHWAMGSVMDLAVDLARITGAVPPPTRNKHVIVCAGDHGVVSEGVSQYPSDVTPQMVVNFLEGGSGINAVSNVSGAKVTVVNAGVASDLSAYDGRPGFLNTPVRTGTDNISVGPAMTLDQAVQAIELGIRAVNDLSDPHIIATGDMGIGNTTPSAGIAAVLTGSDPASVTGKGTGIDDDRLAGKVRIVERAIEVNHPDDKDALDVLSKIGGLEIGAIAGVILGAARHRKPVIIDGFISGAGALIARSLSPLSLPYTIAGHVSEEPGHRIVLDHLNKRPLLDLGLRLGEGTGAALSIPIVETAARLLSDVSTFAEASVSGPSEES